MLYMALLLTHTNVNAKAFLFNTAGINEVD